MSRFTEEENTIVTISFAPLHIKAALGLTSQQATSFVIPNKIKISAHIHNLYDCAQIVLLGIHLLGIWATRQNYDLDTHNSESEPLTRITTLTSTTSVQYTTLLFPPSSLDLGTAMCNTHLENGRAKNFALRQDIRAQS